MQPKYSVLEYFLQVSSRLLKYFVRYCVHKISSQWPSETLTFDLHNLLRLSVGASEYSVSFLKLFKPFMRLW